MLLRILVVTSFTITASTAIAADVNTIAGTGTSGFSGDGGQALQAEISTPRGLAVAADGTVYFSDSDNLRIRSISPTGIIDTIVGNGAFGDDGDGGQATKASVGGIFSVALSPDDTTLYFADTGNSRVRQVNLATGVITNFAGSEGFFINDGGPALNAALNFPTGVATDAAGNVFIADTSDSLVRKVDIKTLIITSVAGNGTSASNIPSPPVVATQASINTPERLTVDSAGDLFILDANADYVVKVDVGSSRVDLQACKLEYSIVSPK